MQLTSYSKGLARCSQDLGEQVSLSSWCCCWCREMLSGVEALKNVAEMLEFVDRISEVRTSDQSRTAS